MIKVNAECDVGIAELVSVLNEINGLITLDSCEHGIYDEAYVYFTYGSNWKDTGRLIHQLFLAFAKCGFCCECSLRLEWIGNNDRPRAKLICDIKHVGGVVEAIKSSIREINDRMFESIHDK